MASPPPSACKNGTTNARAQRGHINGQESAVGQGEDPRRCAGQAHPPTRRKHRPNDPNREARPRRLLCPEGRRARVRKSPPTPHSHQSSLKLF
eukprot:15445153-Alexandrium_andersonii.AAC.1